MLKVAYGECTVSQKSVYKKIVMENRRITIREVAEDVGISVDSYHAIF